MISSSEAEKVDEEYYKEFPNTNNSSTYIRFSPWYVQIDANLSLERMKFIISLMEKYGIGK